MALLNADLLELQANKDRRATGVIIRALLDQDADPAAAALGSVEGQRSQLDGVGNEEVRTRAIHGGVGGITQSDVMLASASNAIMIGVNIRPDATIARKAQKEGVDVRLYDIIYNVIDE